MGVRSFTLQHALVTDPLVGGSSGYRLVARSPGVSQDDADWLAKYPLITDYLHLEEQPGHYFAFHLLRSGHWAFTHRFAQGRRRGNFNRLVVHALVLDVDTLFALQHDPWLLFAQATYRFQGRDGERLRLHDLGAEIARDFQGEREPGVLLPELEVEIASESASGSASGSATGTDGTLEAKRWSVIVSRLGALRKRSDDDSLAASLAAVLDASARGERILWPQEPREVQQMLLAWSILPFADRRTRGYTTHLNLNAASLFAFATVEEPARQIARLPQTDDQLWRLHDDLDSPSADALDWCRLLLAAPDRFRHHLERADQYRFSLDRDLARLGWAASVDLSGGARALLSGFGDLPALEDFLRRARSFAGASGRSPRRDEETLTRVERPSFVLAVAAASLVRLCHDEPPAMALRVIADMVARHVPSLLRAEVALEMSTRLGEEVGASGTLAAIGLAAGEDEVDTADLERLATLWGRLKPQLPAANQGLALHVGEELAMRLSERGARSTGALLAILTGEEQGSDSLLARLQSMPPSPRRRALAASVLESTEDRRLALTLVEEILAPALLEGESRQLLDPHLDRILDIAADRPPLFLGLLAGEREDVAERARHALDALDARRLIAIASAFEAHPAHARRLDSRPLLEGLTTRVAGAGAPADVWLPIAFAEARLYDERSRAAAAPVLPFRELLAAPLEPRAAAARAKDLVALTDASVRDRRFGVYHRALFVAFLKAGVDFTTDAPELREALQPFWSSAQEGIEDWGAVVDELTRRLAAAGQGGVASGLAADWLVAIVRARREGWSPTRLAHLARRLGRKDARRFGEEVVRKVPYLPETELWTALLGEAQPLIEPFDDLVERYRRALLARTVEGGRDIRDAFDAALRTLDARHGSPRGGTSLAPIAALALDLLPREKGRFHAMLRLLTDRRRRPILLEALEERFLTPEEKRRTQAFMSSELPHFEDFEADASPSLLMTVARWLGDAWPADPAGALTFVRRAAERRRFDVVGAFLRRAETREHSFLATLDEQQLRRKLEAAIDDEAHWVDLGPVASRIRRPPKVRRA